MAMALLLLPLATVLLLPLAAPPEPVSFLPARSSCSRKLEKTRYGVVLGVVSLLPVFAPDDKTTILLLSAEGIAASASGFSGTINEEESSMLHPLQPPSFMFSLFAGGSGVGEEPASSSSGESSSFLGGSKEEAADEPQPVFSVSWSWSSSLLLLLSLLLSLLSLLLEQDVSRSALSRSAPTVIRVSFAASWASSRSFIRTEGTVRIESVRRAGGVVVVVSVSPPSMLSESNEMCSLSSFDDRTEQTSSQ
mmetsp:Transcript_9124/g.19133  ORF Transcript_9124/g.19133 Transcript_9124/m.19133 type:complete len:250 (-) Transcript_9124:366-1115(-)